MKRLIVVRKSDRDVIVGIVKLSGFNPRLKVTIADPKDMKIIGVARRKAVINEIRIVCTSLSSEKAYRKEPIVAKTVDMIRPASRTPRIGIIFSRWMMDFKDGLMFPRPNFVVVVEAIMDPSSPIIVRRHG